MRQTGKAKGLGSNRLMEKNKLSFSIHSQAAKSDLTCLLHELSALALLLPTLPGLLLYD